MPPEIRDAIAALRGYLPCLNPAQAIVDRQALDAVLAYLERRDQGPRIERIVLDDPHAIVAAARAPFQSARCRNCGAPR